MSRKRSPRIRSLPAASPEESALFKSAVEGVRPLHHDTLAPPLRGARLPGLHRVDSAPATFLVEPSDNELPEQDRLEFRRPGLQPAHWRRLRRGDFALEASLDLHGQTAEAASRLLARFLQTAVLDGLKCVLVIHGKGLRSPGLAPVLKPRVAFWLAHHADVTAFSSARPIDGGTGALYVLLKRRRQP